MTEPFKKEGATRANDRLRMLRILAYLACGWTLCILMVYVWVVNKEGSHTDQLLSDEAALFFEMIVSVRSWNASHGGVYVPVTEMVKPNKWLKVPDRDIETTDGRKLTKINPAAMTRQLSLLAESKNITRFHLTSLNPIRPGNRPDQWEEIQLNRFKTDVTPVGEIVDNEENQSLFRYMAPLFVTESCLRCHGEQGYRVGDVRGGISVTIDAGPSLALNERFSIGVSFIFGGLWVVGLLAFVVAGMKMASDMKRREEVVSALGYEKDLLALTLGAVRDGIILTDINGNIVLVNDSAASLTGCGKTLCRGHHISDILNLTNPNTGDEIFGKEVSVFSGGENGFAESVYLITEDGRRALVDVAVSPAKGSDGRLSGAFIVMVDRSKEAQLETERIHMYRTAAMGRLAAGMVHGFNNILYPVSGFAELALESLTPGHTAYENLQEVLNASGRGKALVRQLLTLCGEEDPEMMGVAEMTASVKTVLALLKSAVSDKVILKASVSEVSLPVRCGSAALYDIILYLLVNAVASVEPDGGLVSVELKKARLSPYDSAGLWKPEPGDYGLLEVSGEGLFSDDAEKDHALLYRLVTRVGGSLLAGKKTNDLWGLSVYLPLRPEDG